MLLKLTSSRVREFSGYSFNGIASIPVFSHLNKEQNRLENPVIGFLESHHVSLLLEENSEVYKILIHNGRIGFLLKSFFEPVKEI